MLQEIAAPIQPTQFFIMVVEETTRISNVEQVIVSLLDGQNEEV